MKKIFLILLFISFSLSIDNIPNFPDFPDIPDYKKIEFNLDIKNENGGNEIELKKGIYTKILLQLTPNSIIKFSNSDYFIFLNQSSYKLTIDDEKIILLDNELILKPNKEFAYYAYLGISCDTKFDEHEYSIPIKVTPLNDNTTDVPIKYSNIKWNVIDSRKEDDNEFKVLKLRKIWELASGTLKKELYKNLSSILNIELPVYYTKYCNKQHKKAAHRKENS